MLYVCLFVFTFKLLIIKCLTKFFKPLFFYAFSHYFYLSLIEEKLQSYLLYMCR